MAEQLADRQKCVCRPSASIDVDFSTISKHLSVLKQAGGLSVITCLEGGEAGERFTLAWNFARFNTIMQHGVMITTDLVIDGAVKAIGRVMSVEELIPMLRLK